MGPWSSMVIENISHVHNLYMSQLQWRHNERDAVSNHRRLDCLLNRLFSRRSKKTSKLGDRWIPRTKSQWRGKCFHLMTSAWFVPYFPGFPTDLSLRLSKQGWKGRWWWTEYGQYSMYCVSRPVESPMSKQERQGLLHVKLSCLSEHVRR